MQALYLLRFQSNGKNYDAVEDEWIGAACKDSISLV